MSKTIEQSFEEFKERHRHDIVILDADLALLEHAFLDGFAAGQEAASKGALKAISEALDPRAT